MPEQQENTSSQPYGLTMTDTTMEMFAPNKMLVESATMIFIIAFMILMTVLMLWQGPTMEPAYSMAGIFGLFFTFFIAVRQLASFR